MVSALSEEGFQAKSRDEVYRAGNREVNHSGRRNR